MKGWRHVTLPGGAEPPTTLPMQSLVAERLGLAAEHE